MWEPDGVFRRPTAMTIRSTILVLGLCLAVAACGSEQLAVSEERSDAPSSVEEQAAPSESELVEDVGSDQEADEPAALDASADLALGELCAPGPDPSVSADEAIDPGQRSEALVKFLTGIDELVLQEEEEGVDIVYDDPNYGGVWGDFAGGWVVAVLDCSIVDADRIAEIAGGADAVRLIHVAHTFEEVDDFRDRLVSELRASGVAADVLIDSTLTGRRIRVIVNDAEQLDENFGSDIPETAFTIEVGETSQAE